MIKRFITTAVTLLLGVSAQAHVSLEQAKAFAGTGYKAVLRIGHGCEGTGTHTVVVDLPAGFRGAKPMPKDGWTIAIVRSPLAQPYESHGRKVTDDVTRITWTAGSPMHALPDAHYDEFVLRGQAPEQVGPAWFKVRQLCEKGEWNWAEVPAPGADGKYSTKGLKAPAVRLDVHPADHAGHMH
jgi:periplasmic copper chaperone A